MGKKQVIVCVDDEKIILDSLNSALSRNFGDRFNYEFAESGKEALGIIDSLCESNNEVIYAVISDWLMPGMNGDELLNEIRKKVKDVKTILLTGHVDSKLVQAIERPGNEIVCMFKPWNEIKLVNLLKD